MKMSLLVAFGVLAPSLAFACPGSECSNCDKGSEVHAAAVAPAADPASCAKKAELVGSNCSYSTGMMAQRVLSEGATFTYTGTMAASTNQLSSHVASPYTVGAPEAPVHVVANEVVETIAEAGVAAKRVSLEGKVLEVDGVKYLVVTGYQPTTS